MSDRGDCRTAPATPGLLKTRSANYQLTQTTNKPSSKLLPVTSVLSTVLVELQKSMTCVSFYLLIYMILSID